MVEVWETDWLFCIEIHTNLDCAMHLWTLAKISSVISTWYSCSHFLVMSEEFLLLNIIKTKPKYEFYGWFLLTSSLVDGILEDKRVLQAIEKLYLSMVLS